MIFRPLTADRRPKLDSQEDDSKGKTDVALPSDSSRSGSHSRDDSRELLRRLAKVTSTSPSLQEQSQENDGASKAAGKTVKHASFKRHRGDLAGAVPGNSTEAPGIQLPQDAKPSAGVGGLRRIASNESASTKRSSMAQSDGDPTDRIEAEMKLFAPLDNHSERGSIRAPSPESVDENDVENLEETPRPPKPNLLLLPTPKVTGAYIETPATSKVDKTGDIGGKLPGPEPQKYLPSLAVSSFLRGRSSRNSKPHADPGKGSLETRTSGRALSVRRSRSSPRDRPPLFNSAKPSSVRDDLLEIQRLHAIDDSTLDAFDELVPEVVDVVDAGTTVSSESPDVEDEAIHNEFLDHELELATYDRMSKSLKTGLLGIQTAKKGIERLQDKVSHSDRLQLSHDTHVGNHSNCTLCKARQPTATFTYVHVPVPRLYYSNPRFRLTVLGILVVLVAIWLALEGATCSYYCRPDYCEQGRDCSWSPDDPSFGFAMPVKLDQWGTGGQGRVLVHSIGEEVEDLLADAWDFITGADIAAVDTRAMDFKQKRQHRRRLRKKGLVKPWKHPPEQEAKLEAWRSARQARERARDAREMGYDLGDGLGDERMAWDETLSRW